MNLDPNEQVDMPDDPTIEKLIHTARSIRPAPRFASALEAQLRQSHPSQVIRFPRRWIASAAAALTLLLVGEFLLFTPTGRAVAQQMARFIIRDEDNQRTTELFMPTYVPDATNFPPEPTPSAALYVQFPDAATGAPYSLPNGFAQGLPYQVRIATYIPENYAIAWAQVYPEYSPYGGNSNVVQQFDCPDDNWGFAISQSQESPESYQDQLPDVGRDASVEQLVIWGDVSAEYIKGEWRDVEPLMVTLQPGETREMEQIWDADLDYHRITWYADGILYQVFTSRWIGVPNLNATSSCPITREDFIAIAEGLR